LLCEGRATLAVIESEARVACAACGEYVISLEAAWALNALVRFREPALTGMREIIAAHRAGTPSRTPKISVNYEVADRVPTFFFD
jgi:hypothetical protein